MTFTACLAGFLAGAAVVVASDGPPRRSSTSPGILEQLRRRLRRGKRDVTRRAAIVELVRSMAAELHAGRTAEQAFLLAVGAVGAELGEDLAGPAASVAEGADVGSALSALDDSWGKAGLLPLAACCRLSSQTGASLSAALDELAGSLREELRLAEDIRAQLAGPRSTVRLLAGLPLLALLLGAAMGADPFSFLLGSPAGIVCLVVAAALECAGIAWIRRLIRKAVPGSS